MEGGCGDRKVFAENRLGMVAERGWGRKGVRGQVGRHVRVEPSGKFRSIRGVVRNAVLFDPKAGLNEGKGEGESWFE